jgi:heme exporter protein A
MTSSSPVAALDALDLTCIRDDRTLFSGLSFRLESGQALVVAGRNGSGKTTLLRTLSGMTMPDEGSIRWCGNDIYRLGSEYHACTAYVGHRDGNKLDLTPLENLAFVRSLGDPNPDVDAQAALATVKLAGFEDVPTRNLSAGQQRRLALARLLITRAPLWILDEPFTSLDTHGIAIVEELSHNHLVNGGMLAVTSHHPVNLDSKAVIHLNLSA